MDIALKPRDNIMVKITGTILILIFIISATSKAQTPVDEFCPRLEGNSTRCLPSTIKPCSQTRCCGGPLKDGKCSAGEVTKNLCKHETTYLEPYVRNGPCVDYEDVCTGTGESRTCNRVCRKYGPATCTETQKNCVNDCKDIKFVVNGCLCCPPEGCPSWCPDQCHEDKANPGTDEEYHFQGPPCQENRTCAGEGYLQNGLTNQLSPAKQSKKPAKK